MVLKEEGFTLFEMVLALAVSTLSLTTISSSLFRQELSRIGIFRKNVTETHLREVKTLLKSEEQCSCNFSGLEFDPSDLSSEVNLTQISQWDNTVNCTGERIETLRDSRIYADTPILLTSIRTYDFLKISEDYYLAKLELIYENESTGQSVPGAPLRVRKILTRLKTTEAGPRRVIRRCSSDLSETTVADSSAGATLEIEVKPVRWNPGDTKICNFNLMNQVTNCPGSHSNFLSASINVSKLFREYDGLLIQSSFSHLIRSASPNSQTWKVSHSNNSQWGEHVIQLRVQYLGDSFIQPAPPVRARAVVTRLGVPI